MLLQRQRPKTELFLRWLFVASFTDGHTVKQTQADKSLTRTDGTGSAFSDVLAYDKAKLMGFELRNVNKKDSVYVDLIHGSFMINGVPFHAHNQFFEPDKYPLKLIYFRETRVEQNIKGTVQADKTVEQEKIGEAKHYVNRYFIGWETTVNGKNKQVTVAVG